MKIALLVVLQFFPIPVVNGATVHAQRPDTLHRFSQTQAASPAVAAFRDGRDLIQDREWEKAEARFNRFIAEFPADREVAAALYWLAFALKQQNRVSEADAALTRLIQQYPESPWLNDARALRVEIAPRLNHQQLIEQGVAETNDEIRLAALQSLFEARPQRAVMIALDLLKPGSNASRVMKEGAVTLLADAEAPEVVPVLVEVARNDVDTRLRRKAIEALGDIDDERALKALAELARASSNIELRLQAIEALSDRDGEGAVLSLIQLYGVETDERVKESILEALGDSDEKPALQKLIEVARRDTSLRLRKRAMTELAGSDDPEAARFLEEVLKRD